jgi:hypothetical protein
MKKIQERKEAVCILFWSCLPPQKYIMKQHNVHFNHKVILSETPRHVNEKITAFQRTVLFPKPFTGIFRRIGYKIKSKEEVFDESKSHAFFNMLGPFNAFTLAGKKGCCF